MTKNKFLRQFHATYLPLVILMIGIPSIAAQVETVPVAHEKSMLSSHDHDEDTQRIRNHHVNRMLDKLVAEPALLEQSCKYESDISTAPPVNHVALTFDDGPAPGA